MKSVPKLLNISECGHSYFFSFFLGEESLLDVSKQCLPGGLANNRFIVLILSWGGKFA